MGGVLIKGGGGGDAYCQLIGKPTLSIPVGELTAELISSSHQHGSGIQYWCRLLKVSWHCILLQMPLGSVKVHPQLHQLYKGERKNDLTAKTRQLV